MARIDEWNGDRAAVQVDMINSGMWQCCQNCRHFTQDGLCSRAGATPPPNVLMIGCPDYLMDLDMINQFRKFRLNPDGSVTEIEQH